MRKATIEIERDTLIVDGVRITFAIIPEFLYEIAHPDPRKWYSFERIDDRIMVHIEMRPPRNPVTDYPIPTEVRNGNYVTERSSPSFSSQGSEAQDSCNEHRPD